MNIYVARAVAVAPDYPLPSGVRESALPTGFPLLADADSGEVIEPVLLWLSHVHLRFGRHKWVRNTASAQCDDLKDFWNYINESEVEWNKVQEDDIIHYRDIMSSFISRKTHQPLSDGTIKRRVLHVLKFYDWARGAGYYTAPAFATREVRRLRRIDDDPLAHIHSGSTTTTQAALMPDRRANPEHEPRPFTIAHLSSIRQSLGPLPSERAAANAPDTRPSRDRLAAEIGVSSGLRADEVSKLTVHQILDLCPANWEHHDLGPAVPLRLDKTKGQHRRTVPFPTWLLRELDGYIRGERADAVRAAPRGRRPATSLFVNSKQSHAHVGKNITKDTLQHSFHMAVVAAGLVEHVTKTDPDTEKQYVKVNEAMYSFHDLRHTFALANYWTEARRGNREPWKIVQALLGHKSLSTTLRYYLAITPSFEYGISDIMYKWRRNLVFDTDLQ